jgi:pilus assembly protein Flp/PilA
MSILRNTIGLRVALAISSLSLPSLEREEGQTLAEYALILALIAVVVIGAVIFLGGQIQKIFDNIGSAL